jgi:hypothetical protein
MALRLALLPVLAVLTLAAAPVAHAVAAADPGLCMPPFGNFVPNSPSHPHLHFGAVVGILDSPDGPSLPGGAVGGRTSGLFCGRGGGSGPPISLILPLPACSDGINNDPWEDDVADWPWDPGCTDALDPEEGGGIPFPQCADFFDNNGNGLVDREDPACWASPDDPTTYDPNLPTESRPQCSDLADNDGNTKLDAADPGCWGNPTDPTTYDPNDNDETTPECYDTLDNDGNGLQDASDPGCWSNSTDPKTYNPADTDEASTECSDNKDNNGDGKVDRFDPQCWTNTNDPTTYNAADPYEGDDPCGAGSVTITGAPSEHGADYDGWVTITFKPGAFRTITAQSVTVTQGPAGGIVRNHASGAWQIWQFESDDYQMRTFTYDFETACPAGHQNGGASSQAGPATSTNCDPDNDGDNDCCPAGSGDWDCIFQAPIRVYN